MQSFLLPLPSHIFSPLLYHSLIFVLIIRQPGVNFFPTPSLKSPLFRGSSASCDFTEVLSKPTRLMRRIIEEHPTVFLWMEMGEKARGRTQHSCSSPYPRGRNFTS